MLSALRKTANYVTHNVIGTVDYYNVFQALHFVGLCIYQVACS